MDEWERDVAEAPSLVRPYILTAGRTDSRVHLPLEAPIETLDSAKPPRWPGNDVRGQMLAMCVEHPSVAEIAAKLSLPLGVARVLIDDLVGERRLLVHGGTSAEDGPGLELMERVLSGLRGL